MNVRPRPREPDCDLNQTIGSSCFCAFSCSLFQQVFWMTGQAPSQTFSDRFSMGGMSQGEYVVDYITQGAQDYRHLGSSLREICAANRNDEKQKIKALLNGVGPSFCPNYLDWFGHDASKSHPRNVDPSVLSKFLQSRPADFSTAKLQAEFDFHGEKWEWGTYTTQRISL